MSEELYENPEENLEEILAERKKRKKKGITLWKAVRRILLCVFTLVLCVVIAVFSALPTVINGECEPLRDKLVLSAMHASATKWLPALFLPQEKVDEIVASSYETNTDVMSLEEYTSLNKGEDAVITRSVAALGETQTVDNPLITNLAAARNVADWVAMILSERQTISGQFRADPRLDICDKVAVDSKYGVSNAVVITDIKYEFTGAFKGTFTGRVSKFDPVPATYCGELFAGEV